MQIAIITAEFGSNAGGLSFGCLTFAEMLSSYGYFITIISSNHEIWNTNTYDEKFPIIGNKLVICEGGYKKELKENLFFRAHIRNILSEISETKYDYLISFGAGLNGLFASELSFALKVKLLVLLRGSEINLSISDIKLNAYNYHCLKQAQKIIALSTELLDRSKQIYFNPNTEYHVIPNPIDSCNFSSTINLYKKTFVLGCGSKNLNEKKGVANLISMLPYLNKNQTYNFRFEFAGQIDSDLLSNYIDLCNNLNVQDVVSFVGDISRNEFVERMKSWDFYIQGSYCEGFSNSVGDYLSLGKPFVLSNSGFIAESIKSDMSEIVFDNFIPEQMATKLLNIINNPQINSIYKNAYIDISKLTNKNTVNKKWLSVFENKSPNHCSFALQKNNILSVVLHDISDDEYSNIDTNVESFKTFVQRIFDNGYKLCSSRFYFSCSDKSNLIICTFDDGYTGVIEYGLPILKVFGFTATVFVCSDYIGKTNDWNLKDKKNRTHMNTVDLLTLQKEGWEIGSHGLSHRSVLRLSDEDLQNELSLSKQSLELEFGEIHSYAYPYGDYNDYCKSQTASFYKIAFALTQGGTLNGVDNYQIRRYFISEILKQFN
jgi:glycosyltransferase involved in cell wall biosynthesis/peptidoglycan/xylan/chitin deacetylase (PgdA/CDA1 family)